MIVYKLYLLINNWKNNLFLFKEIYRYVLSLSNQKCRTFLQMLDGSSFEKTHADQKCDSINFACPVSIKKSTIVFKKYTYNYLLNKKKIHEITHFIKINTFKFLYIEKKRNPKLFPF